jgi:stearoyl-CoA desaturase (delta-9 desaturase)
VGSQPLWMIPMGYYAGLAGIALGLGLVMAGEAPAWWLLVWLAFHVLGSLMLSVGLHRYFSHGAFRTTRFWHNFMALYSVLLLNGSPQGWAAAHNTHHRWSDTDRDPHFASWHYLFDKRYRDVPMVMWRVKQLAGDRSVVFVHRHGVALWLFAVVSMLAWLPTFFLFAYLMPLGSTHLIGAIHQVTSHRGGAPRDLPWLEFIFPACGEWLHKTHHDHPGWADFRTKWWHLDLGAAFIRMIRTDAPSA